MILKDLKDNLINTINSSNLSIDAVYFVLKDLMNDIDGLYQQEIQKELQEKMQEIQKEQENDKSVQKIEKEKTMDDFFEPVDEIEDKKKED